MRSLFEHCSQVWSPQYASHLVKFENIQRRAIKWINGEPFCSYSEEKYIEELKKLKILPLKLKFLYNDLTLFYKIVNQLVPINLPDNVTRFDAEGSRLTRQNAAVHDRTDVRDTAVVLCLLPMPSRTVFSLGLFVTGTVYLSVLGSQTVSQCLNLP